MSKKRIPLLLPRHQLWQRPLFYHLTTVAQTEGVTQADGRTFMSGAPKALDAVTTETTDALVGLDSNANLDAKVVEGKAGTTQTIDVAVTLADTDKAYFQDNYPNGGYVEGFTFLTALNANGTDLSLPYLGFYGDWTQSPIFDGDNNNPDSRGFFWGDKDNTFYNQYMSARTCALLWIFPNLLYRAVRFPALAPARPWYVISLPEFPWHLLLWVWLAGGLGVLGWYIGQHLRFRRRILAPAAPVSDPQTLEIWEQVLKEVDFPNPRPFSRTCPT